LLEILRNTFSAIPAAQASACVVLKFEALGLIFGSAAEVKSKQAEACSTCARARAFSENNHGRSETIRGFCVDVDPVKARHHSLWSIANADGTLSVPHVAAGGALTLLS